jgi:RNA polymerase sigma-70 factor (ECF subfamily)
MALMDLRSGTRVPEQGHDWDATYVAIAPALLRYAHKLVGPGEASDIVQECFVRAMRTHRAPERTEELRPWLFRIASNLALDLLRRRRRWGLLPLPRRLAASPPDISEAELVRAALSRIPPEHAIALVLRLYERMSREEIANVLGVPVATVKARLWRGRLNFVAAYRRLGGERHG